jgi:hypothetical protein
MNSNQTLVAKSNAFKKLTFSLLLLCAFNSYAQVGVGTQNPATTLDVAGAAGDTPGALNTIDGIAVPVVTDDMTATATAGSKISQLVYSNNAASTGFYFWDGTAWTALSGGGAACPDFTVGTGGILTVTLDGTNNDFSADTTHNSFHITPSPGFGNDPITLPTPADNVGRIIVIKNNGGKGVYVTNAFDGSTAIIGTRAGVFICDGVHWVNSTN